jgi:hypothetical protein
VKRSATKALGLLLAVLAALSLGPAQPVRAEKPSEAQVKAAVLYNLLKFVKWPAGPAADSTGTLSLLVLGTDAVGVALDAYDGNNVRGRRLSVRHATTLEVPVTVHILYLGASAMDKLGEVMKSTAGSPVLTAADSPDFARRGGVFNFGRKEDQVRLDLNVGAARRAGLQISSKVLALATIVSTQP